MNAMFGPVAYFIIGVPGRKTLKIQGLDFSFNCEKTDGSKPSKGKFKSFNLSEETIEQASLEGSILQVFAGYGDASLIFSGDIGNKGVESTRSGSDLVTEIEASDGAASYRKSLINVTFDSAVLTIEALNRVASTMGLPVKILTSVKQIEYPLGITLSGPSRDALDLLCDDVGCKWSIQDGVIVVTPYGEPLNETAYKLSSLTGMLDSPKVQKKGIKIECLMIPQIRPRSKIFVESNRHKGYYVVRKVTHSVDTSTSTLKTGIEGISIS